VGGNTGCRAQERSAELQGEESGKASLDLLGLGGAQGCRPKRPRAGRFRGPRRGQAIQRVPSGSRNPVFDLWCSLFCSTTQRAQDPGFATPKGVTIIITRKKGRILRPADWPNAARAVRNFVLTNYGVLARRRLAVQRRQTVRGMKMAGGVPSRGGPAGGPSAIRQSDTYKHLVSDVNMATTPGPKVIFPECADAGYRSASTENVLGAPRF